MGSFMMIHKILVSDMKFDHLSRNMAANDAELIKSDSCGETIVGRVSCRELNDLGLSMAKTRTLILHQENYEVKISK